MKTLCCPLTSVKRDCLVFSGEICMEWDDYLRQQAAMYRQLAEKAEDAVVRQELLKLATSAKRWPTTSRIVLQAGKWHQPISHSARPTHDVACLRRRETRSAGVVGEQEGI